MDIHKVPRKHFIQIYYVILNILFIILFQIIIQVILKINLFIILLLSSNCEANTYFFGTDVTHSQNSMKIVSVINHINEYLSIYFHTQEGMNAIKYLVRIYSYAQEKFHISMSGLINIFT